MVLLEVIHIATIIFLIALSFSLFLLLYKFVYFIFAFIPQRKFKPAKENHKYAILIPARNESKIIRNLLESINKQTYPRDLIDVYVIVENENDPTVSICKEENAYSFVRKRLELKGKGYALYEMVDHIDNDLKKEYEAYFIFDADNLLTPTYIEEMNKAYDAGFNMGLGYRNSKNWNDGWIAASSGLTFTMMNTCQNKCRSKFGGNIIVSGTGFYVASSVLKEIGGWKFFTLTEDVEISLYSTLKGVRSTYVEAAEFYDEQPIKFKQSWVQRVRWLKGYQQVQKKYGKQLIKSAITAKDNRWFKWEFATSVIPLAMAVASIVIYSLFLSACVVYGAVLGVKGWTVAGWNLMITLAGTYVFLALYTLGMILSERKMINMNKKSKFTTVIMNPIFMSLYLPIAITAFLKREVKWVPIERNVDKGIDEIIKK